MTLIITKLSLYNYFIIRNLYNFKLYKTMKPKIIKQTKESIKLPSIGNKTMGDIFKDTIKQKQRPSSSKNTVSDLEKKLFSHLQTCQQRTPNLKTQKRSSKIKQKDSNPSAANSCKQIYINNKSQQLDGMQKIAQLMPQLYSKIIQSKKLQDVKPLKQTFFLNNQQNLIKDGHYHEMKKTVKIDKSVSHNNKSMSQTDKVSTQRIKSVMETKQSPQRRQKSIQPHQTADSFVFAQKQFQKIYQDYLQQQGLDQIQTPVTQLMDLNHDLQKCQVDIQQLQRNYNKIIQQLSGLCLDDLQGRVNNGQ